jgi:hypothetical protein
VNKTYKKLTSSKHFGGLRTLAGDVVVVAIAEATVHKKLKEN